MRAEKFLASFLLAMTLIPTLHLADKVVAITGASRGIGRAMAQLFAEAGAEVHCLARSSEPLESLREEIESRSGKCYVKVCDVSDFDNLQNVMTEIIDRSKPKRVDILINNAGIYSTRAVRDMEHLQWSSTLNINCSSAFVATRAVLEKMIEQRWGRVLFVSSISGKSGEPYGAAYSASKFAMLGLMQSLALEVAQFGITSNALCPGWVDTEMAHNQINDPQWCALNNLDVAQSEEIARLSVPQERLLEPLEVAQLALYLCSDAARGITGQAINICGGLSIR
jgi:NAD(P)-dependent dehydrogenase (short-subunit alcohol dehydrogenase family)